jgi:hypothetical protein
MARKPRSPAPQPLDTIYATRQGRRPHFLAEWMEHRGIKSQAELAKEIDADKSQISRWLDGDKPSTPSPGWAAKLNAFFGGGGDPVDIFRHPMDDWMAKFLQSRKLTPKDLERGRRMLETMFPEEDEQKSRRG